MAASSDQKTSSEEQAAQDAQLLKEYHSLFSHPGVASPVCPLTGLRLTDELFYNLRKFLLLQETRWLLAMLDVDNLKVINEEIGYDNANIKIDTIGRMIKSFCDDKPDKTLGFRYQVNGKGDTFALLVKYSKKVENVEKRLRSLMRNISDVSNETVTVGLARMQVNDTFKEWIDRSMKHLKHVKLDLGGNSLFSDIHANINSSAAGAANALEAPEMKANEVKQEQEASFRLGTKAELDTKGREIARKEDEHWILALIDADNMSECNEELGTEMANFELQKLENEVIRLCKILGDNCVGFKFGGDEFGMIVYDGRIDDLQQMSEQDKGLAGSEIIETLLQNVRCNCNLTVSVGYTNYNEDEEESFQDWHRRANEYLKHAKHAGKDRAYWGQKRIDNNKDVASADAVDDIKEDDYITFKSLEDIDKLKSSDAKVDEAGRSVSVVEETFELIVNKSRFDKSYLDNIPNCSVQPLESLESVPELKALVRGMSFDSLYKEIYQFDVENGHLQRIRNMTYGKCLFGMVSDLTDEKIKNLKQTIISRDGRRHLSDQLLEMAMERNCLTEELRQVIWELQLSDTRMLKNGQSYQLKVSYFPVMYAYLAYQRYVNSFLLEKLLSSSSTSSTSFASAQFGHNAVEKDNILQFVYETDVHLNEVIKLLILFYCCFNLNYAAIFRPFVKFALGPQVCDQIFASKQVKKSGGGKLGKVKSQVFEKQDAPGIMAYNAVLGSLNAAALEPVQERMKLATQAVAAFNGLVYDMLESCRIGSTGDTGSPGSVIQTFGCLQAVETALHDLVQSMKSKAVLSQMKGLDEDDDIAGDADAGAAQDELESKKKSKFGRHDLIAVMAEMDGVQQEIFWLTRKQASLSELLKTYRTYGEIVKQHEQIMNLGVYPSELVVMLNVPKVIVFLICEYSLNMCAVPKIESKVLQNVVEYLKHHDGVMPQEIPKPVRSVKMERNCDDIWDAHFIDAMSKKMIFQVILAANYLDVNSLVHLGAAKIATLIKGKSPEEIKNILADDDEDPEQESKDDESGAPANDTPDSNGVSATRKLVRRLSQGLGLDDDVDGADDGSEMDNNDSVSKIADEITSLK